jgi:hypothetical protein
MVVVRVADDGARAFEHRREAERCWATWRDRLPPFGLELQAENTRLIACGPHAIANRQPRGEGKPDTCDVLGFTPLCERHRQTGSFTVRRQTARQRMVAKLHALPQQLRHRRHAATSHTGPWLTSVGQGSINEHAVPGKTRTLGTFRRRVIRLGRRQRRRRRPNTRLTWRRFQGLIHRWIPTPRIGPPFPSVRVDARPPRSEPSAGVPHVRICARGAG